MGQIKAVFRDVKTEYLEKLFGGAIIAVHEIDGTTVVETHGYGYVLTETEAALLRALTELDVQRTTDLASAIKSYEAQIGTVRSINHSLAKQNEEQRAAINEMRAELKGLTHELKVAKQDLGLARQKLVAKVGKK